MVNSKDRIRANLKLLVFFVLLLGYIPMLHLRLLFTHRSAHQHAKFKVRKTFCKRANLIFGIRLVTMGNPPPDGTYLYISNHRSFYDPIAFLSHLIANPVSKAEVSRYPLIGWGAQLTEVLMLDRSKRKERGKMKQKIYENLRDGTSILVYPEGTTTDNEWSGEFKKGAFDSAVKARKKVIPIAIEYPASRHYWIEQPLYEQFIYQVAGRTDNRIFLSIGEPMWDPNPLELLAKVQHSIHEQIEVLRIHRNKKE